MRKKLLIINGATQGLGLEIVRIVSENNTFDILCLIRSLNKSDILLELKQDIKILPCDYSNIDEIKKTKNFFKYFNFNNYSEIFFINNIGVITPIGRIGTLESDEIINSIKINISSNLIVLNNFIGSLLISDKSVSILNISSGISKNPVSGLSIYGISKCVLDYITDVLTKEFNGNSSLFRISTFYPGGMKTKMQSILQNELREKESLNIFNYDKIFNQKLLETRIVASIVYQNFLIGKKGWEKTYSNIYDYYNL